MKLSGTKDWIFLDNNWSLKVQQVLTYAIYENIICLGLKKVWKFASSYTGF
jgi:hypothetical protein